MIIVNYYNKDDNKTIVHSENYGNYLDNAIEDAKTYRYGYHYQVLNQQEDGTGCLIENEYLENNTND